MENRTNKTPQVSIGMPVYNGEQFIREALDSLLAQTFTDFELIISDNASTDGTEAICREYATRDARIRYVRWAENRGGIANFMHVLDKAVGEYFMWAAHDDRWDPNWVSSILLNISNMNNVAGFGELMHIDANSCLMHHRANRSKFKYQGPRIFRKLLFFLSYEAKGKANLFYAIYPRDALLKLDIERLKYDYVILFCLLDIVSFKYVPGPFFYKRIHCGCEGRVCCKLNNDLFFYKILNVIKFDLIVLYRYFLYSRLKYKIIISIFSILKILISVRFHAGSFFLLANKKLFSK